MIQCCYYIVCIDDWLMDYVETSPKGNFTDDNTWVNFGLGIAKIQESLLRVLLNQRKGSDLLYNILMGQAW